MFILDGKPLSPDRAFTHDGIQYPANWLRLASPAERAAIGITEVPDPTPYDQRFQWGWTEGGQPIWKDHAQLVEQWTQQTRTTANTLLAPTDWIIIREADNGKAADPLLKTWREDIRLATGVKNEAIAATVDTQALAEYITGAEYPVWPADPYAPVPVSDAGDTPADGVVPSGDGEQS
jgi:hypothetical protein